MGDFIWSYIYRREFLVGATGLSPFIEGETLFEDTLAMARIIGVGNPRVVTLDVPLYNYIATPGSMARGASVDRGAQGLDVIRQLRAAGLESDLGVNWAAKYVRMAVTAASLVSPDAGGGKKTTRELARLVRELWPQAVRHLNHRERFYGRLVMAGQFYRK